MAKKRQSTTIPPAPADADTEAKTVQLEIRLEVPDGTPMLFANQSAVINSGSEFFLCFFQAAPPVAGLPEDNIVKARCMVQVVLSPPIMQEFVAKAVGNLQAFMARKQRGEP